MNTIQLDQLKEMNLFIRKKIKLIATNGMAAVTVFIIWYFLLSQDSSHMLDCERKLLSQLESTGEKNLIGTDLDHKSPSLVYVKTHKTGSTTLSTIIQSYGYRYKKSFAFNKHDRWHFGHLRSPIRPETPRKNFAPPINCSKEGYDIMAMHFIYDDVSLQVSKKIMKGNDIKFISILRDPANQYDSYFNYFNMAGFYPEAIKAAKENKVSVINELMNRTEYYFSQNNNSQVDYVRNNQIKDFGMECSTNEQCSRYSIAKRIEQLEREMDLVLITEYFDESLILMGKLLNWKMDDLLYAKNNIREKKDAISEDLVEKVRRWNYADYMVYQHFNKTLWAKIEHYGPKFNIELQQFQDKLNQMLSLCFTGNDRRYLKIKQKNLLFKTTHSEYNTSLVFKTIYSGSNNPLCQQFSNNLLQQCLLIEKRQNSVCR